MSADRLNCDQLLAPACTAEDGSFRGVGLALRDDSRRPAVEALPHEYSAARASGTSRAARRAVESAPGVPGRAQLTERAGNGAAGDGAAHLRVLIANERRDRLELLAQVVAGLGHEVVAREVEVREVAAVTKQEHPDVALVGLGLSSDHALDLITEIVREASCPVIALLSTKDPAYVREAARRGVFAYIVDTTPEELQSALDITLQRFGEYHNLQGAFGRRALIEQAKGILMARRGVSADKAFELLREHSQHDGHKLADVAAALVESHQLLMPPAEPGPSERRD